MTNELQNGNLVFQGGPTPPTVSSDGTVWNVTCNFGFRWLDGLDLKQLKCFVGFWTYPIACQRTSFQF